LPSNHGAIVSSSAALIAMKQGVDTPAFGLAVTLAFIVILDAASLRRQVGRHAAVLNQLAAAQGATSTLRERMGHTPFELLCGVAVGVLAATLVHGLLDGH